MPDSTVNNTGDPITLDGTENTVVETAAGVTGHATTQAIADLAGIGPFTDGDGNVYSIEYDGDAKTLALRCVDSGGGVTVSLVGPQEAHITVTSADENSVSDLEVDGSSFRMQSYTVEPDQGTSISVAQSGIEISTQVGVDAALPLTINGVAIDPTLPWPGG